MKTVVPSCTSAAATKAPAPDPRLRKAADGFEALFISKLMQSARAAKLGDGLFSSSAMKTEEGMLDHALGQTLAGHAHLGIADALVREFTRTPHGGSKPCR